MRNVKRGMATRYEASGWFKIAEEDTLENGCVGPASYAVGHECFANDTVAGLAGDIADFFGVDVDHVTLDACGEAGRLDLRVTENDDATIADGEQIEQWHQGARRLWAVTYTFHVERVRRQTVALSPLAPGFDSEGE